MEDNFKDQAIDGLLLTTGEWMRLCVWSSEGAEYDAPGWMSEFGERIGSGTATLPDGGWIDLTSFAAIRPIALVP